MAEKTNEEILEEFQNEEEFDNSERQDYVDSLVKIKDLNIIDADPDHHNPFVSSCEPGTKIFEAVLDVIDGEHKGVEIMWYGSVLTRSGKKATYYTFEGSDGSTVPASMAGDIMHRVHEAEGDGVEQPKGHGLRKGLKFKIGIKMLDKNGLYPILLTERQRLKDEEYARQYEDRRAEEQDSARKPENDEEIIDPEDLPF